MVHYYFIKCHSLLATNKGLQYINSLQLWHCFVIYTKHSPNNHVISDMWLDNYACTSFALSKKR